MTTARTSTPCVSPVELILAEVEAAVSDLSTGAVVSFAGAVRNHDRKRTVVSLAYEGHPSADEVLSTIVAEAHQRPGVVKAAAAHRVGSLSIGELAFVAAVSSAHRGDAFAACAWLVDEVKSRLPVWKHQVFDDGTSEWVNCA